MNFVGRTAAGTSIIRMIMVVCLIHVAGGRDLNEGVAKKSYVWEVG